LRAALVGRPKSPALHAHLGRALGLKKGLQDEAIACCKKAIELDPNVASWHNNLGNALREQGKPDEAIAAHRKAIELDPKYAPAHTGLGNALYDQGKLDEAIAAHR